MIEICSWGRHRIKKQKKKTKKTKKKPPKQTKEEDIGSFPEKEFRIMRVKMTQLLKAK